MTNIELKVALRSLEARVLELEKVNALIVASCNSALQMAAEAVANKPSPAVQKIAEEKVGRALCPKCGVKPNHFFHVRTCTGKKEEQKDAANGPGTSNTA